MQTDPKDPAETITVTFDFSALTDAVTGPTVTATLETGTDADPSAILSGVPQVSGALVLQQVIAGNAPAKYHLRCVATASDDSIYVVAGTLPVMNF